MKKYQLQKIDVASVAKIYLVFGILMGLFIGGFSLLGITIRNPNQLIFGISTIFFMILVYGLLGAVFTALTIWIYNLIAKRIGGVTVYLKEEQYHTPGPINTDSRNDQDDPTLV